MYEVMVKLGESRASPAAGPLRFVSKEERERYVNGPDSIVYWYTYPEEDDWTHWRRGGAWKRTQEPAVADRKNTPPEITDKDRRW
jgi:hypothetical protein